MSILEYHMFQRALLEPCRTSENKVNVTSNLISESHLVNCKSCCGVGKLPDKRCREPIVERQKAFRPGKNTFSWKTRFGEVESPDDDFSLGKRSYVSILLCLQLDLEQKVVKKIFLWSKLTNLDQVKRVSAASCSGACEPAEVPAAHSLLLRHSVEWKRGEWKTGSKIEIKSGNEKRGPVDWFVSTSLCFISLLHIWIRKYSTWWLGN